MNAQIYEVLRSALSKFPKYLNPKNSSVVYNYVHLPQAVIQVTYTKIYLHRKSKCV